MEVFSLLQEAKAMTENYRQDCHTYRTHSSLGYRTPSEFTLDWKTNPGLAKSLEHERDCCRSS